MPAPAETIVEAAGPAVDGEIPIRLPILVIENLDTSDGRFLAAGSITPRALPLSLLAQPESMHGGNEPGPAGVVGRIDTLERLPGPEVTSPRTGEPFPEGTFVWSGTGTLMADARVGIYNIAELFRRGYLRGISVDLAGMDYEVLGDDGSPIDPANPRRNVVAHSAELAAATLVCIPAFGDAYAEPAAEESTFTPVAPEDLPAGLCAAAIPAWRSPELDGLVADGGGGVAIEVPPDAAEQIAAVIDTGEQRDAQALAADIVAHIATWGGETPVEEPAGGEPAPGPAFADDPEDLPDDEGGDPEEPQPCEFGPEPATLSLLYRDGEAYVPTCEAHRQDAEEQLAALGETISGEVPITAADVEDAPPAELAAEPGPIPEPPGPEESETPMGTGMPDEPQDCLMGDEGPHPATVSLIFGSGEQYIPTCDQHAAEAASMVEADGFQVEQEVPIVAAGEQTDDMLEVLA